MLKFIQLAHLLTEKITFGAMVKTVTHNIEISVDCKYLVDHSSPRTNHYFFVYYITIHNKGDYAIKLLKRHWDITDSNGEKRIVDGEGVVGEFPELMPNQKFEYNSGCNLVTEIGQMKGYYTFERMFDNTEIKAVIPKFDLVVPAKMN